MEDKIDWHFDESLAVAVQDPAENRTLRRTVIEGVPTSRILGLEATTAYGQEGCVIPSNDLVVRSIERSDRRHRVQFAVEFSTGNER